MMRDFSGFLRGIDEAERPAEVIVKTRGRKVLGRRIQTSRGGPNAPKYQPCPECRRGSRRTIKSGGMAYYRCPKHGEFPVRLRR